MSDEQPIDICIPRETVNDDSVTLLEWKVVDGGPVQLGQVVALVETSKSVLELESPSAGILQHLARINTEIAIGGAIGAVSIGASNGKQKPKRPIETGAASGEQLVSAKAQELIDEHQLDLGQFNQTGMIRKSDVIAVLEQSKTKPTQAAENNLPKSETLQPANPPAAKVNGKSKDKRPKGIFGDARRSAKERGGKSVIWLAFNYAYKNWILGLVARVSPRGVINFVHRRRGVKMGKHCYIDPTAILETAYPENITMGEDVRIAAGAVIMTHIKAPHYHRDHNLMPAVLKPVILADHVFVGVNAVIMPGVRVGKAAVIVSGAVVSEHVPDHSMVAGSPARVIKRFSIPNEAE